MVDCTVTYEGEYIDIDTTYVGNEGSVLERFFFINRSSSIFGNFKSFLYSQSQVISPCSSIFKEDREW